MLQLQIQAPQVTECGYRFFSMIFIKCFKISLLLSVPTRTSERPSYLFSLLKTMPRQITVQITILSIHDLLKCIFWLKLGLFFIKSLIKTIYSSYRLSNFDQHRLNTFQTQGNYRKIYRNILAWLEEYWVGLIKNNLYLTYM